MTPLPELEAMREKVENINNESYEGDWLEDIERLCDALELAIEQRNERAAMENFDYDPESDNAALSAKLREG